MSRVHPVTLAQAKDRLTAYQRTNGAGPHPAASLADFNKQSIKQKG